MGRQYDKQHATTVVLTAAVEPHRLISFAGAYAVGTASAGGSTDAQGVSETAGASGEAIAVTTSYSALVEAGAAITKGAFVKPGTSGKAVTGSITDNCGRALAAAGAEGDLIEVALQPHVHPVT